MKRASACAMGLMGLSLAAAGCHHSQHRRSVHDAEDADRDRDERHDERDSRDGEPPALGSGISTSLAVSSIANARCEREKRCDNLGDGEKYATEASCEQKVKGDWNDELNKYECPNGIVQAELDECLADIRAEECGNPFDSLARLVSCNAGDICDD
jgi:hypothetical protein